MKSLPSIPSWLKRRIPSLGWLAHYQRKDLRGDALAGLIVATLLIPQAMAYALLAGLPPQVGLYASLLPLAVYALLGSSRYLSVGPSALLSLLILTQVAAWAEPGSARYLAFAMATALLAGAMQIAMGAARLGVLTNFLSSSASPRPSFSTSGARADRTWPSWGGCPTPGTSATSSATRSRAR